MFSRNRKYLDKNSFINHDIRGYNFFIRGLKDAPKMPLNHYEIYTQFKDVNDFNPSVKLLSKKFKNFTFKMQETINYGRKLMY